MVNTMFKAHSTRECGNIDAFVWQQWIVSIGACCYNLVDIMDQLGNVALYTQQQQKIRSFILVLNNKIGKWKALL